MNKMFKNFGIHLNEKNLITFLSSPKAVSYIVLTSIMESNSSHYSIISSNLQYMMNIS